jgi:hypothetical protein
VRHFEGDGTEAGGPEVTSFIDNVITIKRGNSKFRAWLGGLEAIHMPR